MDQNVWRKGCRKCIQKEDIMDVSYLLKKLNADFYTGVPDSLLKPLCNCLMNNFGISNQHIIAANEGNCTALAAGYYLATGKIPVVYMQNSGIGNIVNPVVSLLNEKVYGIPCIFIIGWRGEPGVHDEPQHIFQGEISEKLLKDIGIYTIVLGKDTCEKDMENETEKIKQRLKSGQSVAFLVKKDAFSSDYKVNYQNSYTIVRESAIEHIVDAAKQDLIISTTGKISRELFEIRNKKKQEHQFDFLTVGSMGHSSSIALGIALNRPDKTVWCLDGDGAALMHMGSMAVIGGKCPSNMIHILINNQSYETVGGMPTAASSVNWQKIAEGCGYPHIFNVETLEELEEKLTIVKSQNELSFLEVKCAIGSRMDLGRPTTSAQENKKAFMNHLKV